MATANIKAVITAEDHTGSVLAGFGSKIDAFGASVVNMAKRGAVALGAAGVAATGFAIKSAADFEQTRIGLENMLGSADKARVLLSQISKFAAETPFEFPELAQAARQLVAFGFSADDAFKTMKQLGDVSAAVGAPINDLAYLMGTLRAQGRAFTIDIRQFAMRGIPIYEYLGKVLNKNTQEITQMIEAGKIGFPEVQKAFEAMTAEGGAFHGTMIKQSKSLSGLFSTLKDEIGQTARELIGITQEGDVKQGSLFDRVRIGAAWLIENLPKAIQAMRDAIDSFLPTLMQWGDNIVLVAQQIGDYLQPKLQVLWDTLNEKLMPALVMFWKKVLEPLVPVIGTALVLALGLAVDALNALLTALTPVIEFLSRNQEIFWSIVAVLGAIRLALFLQGALAAFQGVMDSVIASYAGMATVVTAPLVMPAIAVGAALLALWQVRDAAFQAWDAVKNAKNATETLAQSNRKILQNLQAQTKAPFSTEVQARARAQIKALAASGQFDTLASGTDYARGGPTILGEQGPEVVNLPRGSKVYNNRDTTAMLSGGQINITIQAGAFMGSQQDARKYAMLIMDAYKDAMGAKGMAV